MGWRWRWLPAERRRGSGPVALERHSERPRGLWRRTAGRYVLRGGNPQSLEGDPPKGFIVVIGFDSVEKARAWHDSPEYSAIRPFRQSRD